jgi:DNA-binding transcriptional ArsR family regulator
MSLDRIGTEASAVGFAPKAGQPAKDGAPPASLVSAMADHAEPAAALMKALSHEGRLLILCHLAAGEKSVSELETLIGQRQAAVSQQLARLRLEGLVTTRRAGKAIYYTIRDQRTIGLLSCLPKLFDRAA